MKRIHLQEAKTQLVRLVAPANGNEIIIANARKLIVRPGPIAQSRPSRQFGVLKDELRRSDRRTLPPLNFPVLPDRSKF